VIADLWNSGVSALTDPIDAGVVREIQDSTLAQAVAPEVIGKAVRESLKTDARLRNDFARARDTGFLTATSPL